jgi:hypothetical protein
MAGFAREPKENSFGSTNWWSQRCVFSRIVRILSQCEMEDGSPVGRLSSSQRLLSSPTIKVPLISQQTASLRPFKLKYSFLFVYCLFVVFYFLLGTFLFFYYEKDWTLFDSFYFVMITFLTIGLSVNLSLHPLSVLISHP